MMIEFIILISSVIAAYSIGNLAGYSSGKKHARAHGVNLNTHTHMSQAKHDLIDDLSRQSLAWNEEDQTYVKVYDAEVIDFPLDHNDYHSKR